MWLYARPLAISGLSITGLHCINLKHFIYFHVKNGKRLLFIKNIRSQKKIAQIEFELQHFEDTLL